MLCDRINTPTLIGLVFVGTAGCADAGEDPDGVIESYEEARCPLTDIKRIAAAHDHTCVIRDDGGAACWGRNFGGQLGHGARPSGPETASELARRCTMPIRVLHGWNSGSGKLRDLAVGAAYSCFQNAYELACTGPGFGDIPTTFRPLKPLSPTASFGGIGSHFCVQSGWLWDSQLNCFGNNSDHQLGYEPDSYAPDRFPHSAMLAALGFRHTCSVDYYGFVNCWGSNDSGQLGHPDDLSNGTESIVWTGTKAGGVAAGGSHSSLSTVDGAVFCFGGNENGQLGVGDQLPHPEGPVRVEGIPTPVTEIHAGLLHTCARSGGELYCWGDNSHGQLGFASPALVTTPTLVTLPEAIRTFTTGSEYTCVVGVSNQAWCFGNNSSGQLGDGTWTDRKEPTPVVVPCDSGLKWTPSYQGQ
ncbi:MAG: RCC1 domain-containing protein [Kofleriaceae bacterium]